MYHIPQKISLANLPTRIEKLERLSKELGKNIYLKRDDQTGIEVSGNKVRKLEYSVAEAQREGATVLITCGALQSNHARATAVVANKLGMKSVLVLVDGEKEPPNGNYLLDLILGADIRLIEPERYAEVLSIMEGIKEEYAQKGEKAYIIPTGASNAIGMFGYIEAIREIIAQEKAMGIHFDAVVDTVGSTGTYAGLVVGNAIYNGGYDILGFSISDTREAFQQRSYQNIIDCCKYLSQGGKVHTPQSLGIAEKDLQIIDEYRGRGYALNEPDDFEFLKEIARKEGIFVDPVYTGKALKGLIDKIRLANAGEIDPIADFGSYQNILFIHTGGLYGLFPKGKEIF
ncbi:MAG: D-cysteine desulfhydrase family protein [Peptostreptococcaceae bacterium]|nr:D-cysteine desulfhydrase family protein [Peptostreptococcaceae bacterium]